MLLLTDTFCMNSRFPNAHISLAMHFTFIYQKSKCSLNIHVLDSFCLFSEKRVLKITPKPPVFTHICRNMYNEVPENEHKRAFQKN